MWLLFLWRIFILNCVYPWEILLLFKLENVLLAVLLLLCNGEALLDVEVPLHLREQQVRHQEYLSRWEEEVDGEVVVGVGGVVVDPELPQDRSQRSRSHQNTTDQERLFKEWQKVPEEGEEGKEEANVPEAGVGLEDGD